MHHIQLVGHQWHIKLFNKRGIEFKQKIKTWARQRIGEMKAEIENMGALYKEICLEILQRQFDGASQVKRVS